MDEIYKRKELTIKALMINESKSEIEEQIRNVIQLIKTYLGFEDVQEMDKKVKQCLEALDQLFECVRENKYGEFNIEDMNRYKLCIEVMNYKLMSRYKSLELKLWYYDITQILKFSEKISMEFKEEMNKLINIYNDTI